MVSGFTFPTLFLPTVTLEFRQFGLGLAGVGCVAVRQVIARTSDHEPTLSFLGMSDMQQTYKRKCNNTSVSRCIAIGHTLFIGRRVQYTRRVRIKLSKETTVLGDWRLV
jgi:hypothetical protein